MTLTMGILSAFTTGYWGQTSDRVGRSKVMALVEVGLLLKYALFLDSFYADELLAFS